MNVREKKAEELIVQYLVEGLNEQDLIWLNQWLDESEENKNYFNHLQEIWISTANQGNRFSFDKEKAYSRFRLRVNAAEAKRKSERKVSIFVSMQRVAAAILLLILFSGFGYWISQNVQNKQYSNIFVEAPLGSKVKLYLPDKTLVWLNSGSSIEYSQALGIKDRKLTLNGEAYFEVTRNEKKVFEVTSNDMTVRVLGTKFNIRDFVDEEQTTVTLLEGKVNVAKAGKEEIVLHPNQQFAYNKKELRSEIIDVKAKQVSEWIDGIIFFDGESLPDIVRELERLYNVRISIDNETLKNYHFYGKFYRTDQTIQEVIDMLATTNKLKYKIVDNKVITLY